MEGRLLLHALGKAANGAFPGKLEHLIQPLKQGVVEGGVDPPIESVHVLQSGAGVVEHIVGDAADAPLGGGVLKNRRALQGDLTAVRAVDAGQVADGGGLARAVGAHQAINPAFGYGEAQIVQSPKRAKGFGDVFHFKHVCFLLPAAARSDFPGIRPGLAELRRLHQTHRTSALAPARWLFHSR